MRWLLNVTIDSKPESLPRCVATVDELLALLVAEWRRRRGTPDPAQAEGS
jgi:hypothetical protein